MATDTATRAILGLLLTCVLVAGVVMNVLFFIIYGRCKQFRKPPNFLFVNLFVADLLALGFWLIPSLVSAATSSWPLGDGMCKFQGFVCTLCYCSNVHTLLLMSFEKALRHCWPSRHREVFYNTVVLIMIMTLWVLDLVFAIFPLVGWGKLVFFENQYQCSYDFEKSMSHLNFMFVMTFVIPIILGAVCYVAMAYKISKRRRHVDHHGNVIMEEDMAVPKEAYAEKLKKQQNKFKLAPMRQQNKGLSENKKSKDDGYESVSSSDGEPEPEIDSFYTGDYRPRRRNNRKKRIHRYRRQDTRLAITILIAWAAYMLCWFPYFVLSYQWALNVFNQPTDVAFRALTFITFLGLVVKPPVFWITNGRVREYTREALGMKSRRNIEKSRTTTTITATEGEETTATTTSYSSTQETQF